MEFGHLRRLARIPGCLAVQRLSQALDEALTPAPRGVPPRYRWALGATLLFQLGLSLWLGWPQPDPSRWWDERFNVANIESSLQHGRLSPANGYYGGVSYVPQTVVVALAAELHARTGWEAVDVLSADGTLGPAGYRLIRATQALWAALAVALTFALARRLASPEVALIAAALLAVSPRLIHAGAIFKPDIELLTATLLALVTGWLAAARRPHAGRYALAGVAVGLAVGAKLNGVTAAGPIVLATGLRWRELGRWPRLALAGLAAIAAYWLFNPDFARTLRSLARNQEHYTLTATGGWLEVLIETVLYPFHPTFLGPFAGALAAVGGVALGVHAVRRKGDAASRLGWWMVLSFPAIYYAAYVATSPRAKANHFLQVLPIGALFAAIALTAIGRWFLGAERRSWRLAAVGLVAASVVGIPAAATCRQVYELVVPSTWQQARDWVERSLPAPARGFRIVTLGGVVHGRSPASPAYEILPIDSRVSAPTLDDADGVIAGTALLETRPELVRLWSESRPRWARFEGRLFRARGEPVVALLRPSTPIPDPAAGRILFRADPAGELRARLPAAIEAGALLSVRLRLRLPAAAGADLRLRVGEHTVGWIVGPPSAGDTFFLSDRFRAPAESELRVSLPGKRLQAAAKGELFLWRR